MLALCIWGEIKIKGNTSPIFNVEKRSFLICSWLFWPLSKWFEEGIEIDPEWKLTLIDLSLIWSQRKNGYITYFFFTHLSLGRGTTRAFVFIRFICFVFSFRYVFFCSLLMQRKEFVLLRRSSTDTYVGCIVRENHSFFISFLFSLCLGLFLLKEISRAESNHVVSLITPLLVVPVS